MRMKQTNINTAANVSRGIRPSPLIILFNFATRTEPTFLAFFLVPPGLEAFAFVGVRSRREPPTEAAASGATASG